MRIVAQSREAPRGERLRARQLDPIASKRTSTRAVTTYLQYPALQTGAVMLRLQAPIDLDQALKLLAAHAAVAGTPERDRPYAPIVLTALTSLPGNCHHEPGPRGSFSPWACRAL